jgi:large conductance mechanosensitive channel
MGFVKEFKEFAMKGNLIDMAIGVVIGAAFGKVTSAFIDGVFMPLVGLVFQVGDLSKFVVQIGVNAKGEPNMIKVGDFVGSLINFIIIAFVMFMIIKGMNTLNKRMAEEKPATPPAPAPPTKEEILLTEIRDALRNK